MKNKKQIELKITNYINPIWAETDKLLAKAQLEKFGVIFLNRFYKPIIDINVLNELNERYMMTRRGKGV